jgi:transglutaminase-like putative cysteine protease
MSRFWLCVLTLTLSCCSGCHPGNGEQAASGETHPADEPAHGAPLAAKATPDLHAATESGDREIWEMHTMRGTRVGYDRVVIRQATDASRPIVRIEGWSHLKFRRAADEVELDVKYATRERPQGRLLDFSLDMAQGAASMLTATGRVENDQLRLEVGAQGKTTAASIPWSDDYGGLYALEESLAARPLTPGQQRTLRAFVPGFNQLGTLDLTARQYEEVKWPESIGSRSRPAGQSLLRIDVQITLAGGQKQEATVWTDHSGEVLARREQAMDLRSFRVPKEVALAETGEAPFDLVLGLSVNLDRPLPGAHRTRRARYRLHLADGDPAKVFPSGPSQEVKRIDAHTAEMTVYALRPDRPAPLPVAADPPSPSDRRPNSLIQSDDVKIVEVARQVAPGEKDPWRLAVALEKKAHDLITKPDYSSAFASAAEVVRSGEGDCTEHSVLLAALARARDIPARVVVGLVYTEQTGGPSLGYHMWNELYLGDRWIPMDATLGQGGIGAAHLELGHTDLDGVAAFSSFLPVAQVAGQLRVEVLEAE